MRKTGFKLRHDIKGSVLIESALALPVLFLFGFGIIEVSRGLWVQNTLQFAVEAAARCAAVDSFNCGTDAGVQSTAVAAATGVNVPATSYTVDSTLPCGKKVSVNYTFDGGIPGFGAFAPVLHAESCHPT